MSNRSYERSLRNKHAELFDVQDPKQKKALDAFMTVMLDKVVHNPDKKNDGRLSKDDKDSATIALLAGKDPKKVARGYGLTFPELWKRLKANQKRVIRMTILDIAAEKAVDKARTDAEKKLDALIKG